MDGRDMTGPEAVRRSPTRPPPSPGMSSVLDHNIHALADRRRREEANASLADRIADAVTRFTGSMTFVVIHLVIFGFWIVANLGLVPGVPRWDPTFVVLAMWASVEAIFLSTFVLISQNRMAAAQMKRADLDLQVSLLAEHEISKIAAVLARVAGAVGVDVTDDRELREATANVAPEAVLDEIEDAERER